jgi:hypothetical protein
LPVDYYGSYVGKWVAPKGNDTIKAASGQITTNDTINGGEGTDTLEFTNAVTLDVTNGGANASDFSKYDDPMTVSTNIIN